MHEVVSCPICTGVARFAFAAGDSFYKVTAYKARMFACGHCGVLFQWPIPSRETLAGFYPSGYWQEGENPGLLNRLQQYYIEKIMAWDLMAGFKKMKLAPGSSVLDVGCSRGDWLAQIRNLGYQVQGLEGDPRAAEYARSIHQIPVTQADVDKWQPMAGSFDAILFFHLLEHLRSPLSFLQACHRGLKPGGRIFMRVPNVGSFQARLFGRRWKGLEVPRHIILFQPRSLRLLLDQAGFEIDSLRTWSLRDGPPALASSIFPSGEPTFQQIHKRPAKIRLLTYLGLNWVLTPLELGAALLGQGAMITLTARKRP